MKRLVPSSMYGDYETQLLLFTNVLANGCWEFTGYTMPQGYGQLGRNIIAHRFAWEIANGRPVPAGLHVDHVCHNADPDCHDNDLCAHRRCVNPDHLEAVPPRINMIRGKGFAGTNSRATHCPSGHEYTDENTYLRPDRPGRVCRICRHENGKGRGHGLVRPDTPIVRAWAVAQGLPVTDRGAIPKRIRELYETAALEAMPRAG